MTRAWRCLVCGYVHLGDEAPEVCPLCGASRSDFEPVEEPGPAPAESGNAKPVRLVIVGAGIAGVTAAETARELSPDSDITLVSAEEPLPYARLNLTRYLAGDVERGSLPLLPEETYAQKRIRLMRGTTVTRLDPAALCVVCSNGERVEFEQLILATGAQAFRPPAPGADGPGIRTLRSLDDADAIVSRTASGAKCVFIGGGILGLEAAAGVARRGVPVVLLEHHGWLLSRQLNQTAGRHLAVHARKAGIDLREGVRVASVDPDGSGVRLASGERIESGMVVFTAGIRPDSGLARDAGLSVHHGVVVNDSLAASIPAIWAAGDVAEHRGVTYGLWDPARYQGQIAARNALGLPTQFTGVPPATTLKVLGVSLFSVGLTTPAPSDGVRIVEEGDESGYRCFVLREGRMCGAILLGDIRLAAAARAAVDAGLALDSGASFARIETLLQEAKGSS